VAKFNWQQLPGLFAPVQVAVMAMEFPGQPSALVGGLWDTGATVTTLLTNVEQPRLGVPDDQCVPMGFDIANGAKVWEKVTLVNARLDGHVFRIPVAFADSVPLNLVGRVGIVDQWEVVSDPSTFTTSFNWQGAAPIPGNKPWAEVWEAYWHAMLDLGYSWTNWNANGRPDLPSTPLLPAAMPPAPP
jgi:hypothetical protein